jgi:uncharacterized protein YjbI with pentapeptide repeats
MLAEADLSFANLDRATLLRADLYRACGRGLSLRHTDLTHARGYGLDLREATLYGTDLRWAELPKLDLRGARVLEIRSDRANLRGLIQ